MEQRPADVDEAELRDALTRWGVSAATLDYAAVGFGDHHWIARDTGDERWFVTVADLADKPYCGDGVEAAGRGLRRAMDTAAALRTDRGLDFVLAPLPDRDGGTLRRLGDRYGVSVFPFVPGTSGPGDVVPPAPERARTLAMLAALHRTEPPAATPVPVPDRPARELAGILADLGRPWDGGPFAEPARDLLSRHAASVRGRLAEFDRLAVALDGVRPVVTHGEPHPANLLRHGDTVLLVDWDTVGLGVPERDLWHVLAEPSDVDAYRAAGGRRPDPDALAFYRLHWDVDDLVAYLRWFRAPHRRTPDTEKGWRGVTTILSRFAAG